MVRMDREDLNSNKTKTHSLDCTPIPRLCPLQFLSPRSTLWIYGPDPPDIWRDPNHLPRKWWRSLAGVNDSVPLLWKSLYPSPPLAVRAVIRPSDFQGSLYTPSSHRTMVSVGRNGFNSTKLKLFLLDLMVGWGDTCPVDDVHQDWSD